MRGWPCQSRHNVRPSVPSACPALQARVRALRRERRSRAGTDEDDRSAKRRSTKHWETSPHVISNGGAARNRRTKRPRRIRSLPSSASRCVRSQRIDMSAVSMQRECAGIHRSARRVTGRNAEKFARRMRERCAPSEPWRQTPEVSIEFAEAGAVFLDRSRVKRLGSRSCARRTSVTLPASGATCTLLQYCANSQ
jgi:hypothetical protein